MGLTQAITINLEHFSAAGVGQGQAGNGGVPTAYEDRLSAVMQTIALQQRQCSPGVPQDNPQWLQELAGNLQLYYDKVVVPGLEAAKTDDSLAQSAITIALSLARTTALFGLDQDEPMATGVDNLSGGVSVINTQSQVATQTVPMTFNASQLWRELDRAGRASGIGPHRHSRVPALLPDVD